MKYIIFNGPPGSGKDEACHFLKVNYGYRHLQFKDQLFIDTAEYFNVSLDWFLSDYDNRSTKEMPVKELNGFSRRAALIHVSEDIVKKKYGKDYYGLKTAEKIDSVSDYCFSDGGFIEEVLPVINTVGQDNICIVQLYRNGCYFSSDSRNYINGILEEEFGNSQSWSHFKNTQEDLPIRMYRVNNDASVSNFHQNIRKILRKEANAISKDKILFRKSV
jgi:hypothetical protein